MTRHHVGESLIAKLNILVYMKHIQNLQKVLILKEHLLEEITQIIFLMKTCSIHQQKIKEKYNVNIR
jgi:hypothetical protein